MTPEDAWVQVFVATMIELGARASNANLQRLGRERQTTLGDQPAAEVARREVEQWGLPDDE